MQLTEEIPADSGSDRLRFLRSGGVSGRMSSGANACIPTGHHPSDPGTPLNGPTTALVIQPP